MALKGASVLSDPPIRKQPVTYEVLCKLISMVNLGVDGRMLTTAMTLAFFGCLRSGEVCISDSGAFDPKVHPCVGVDSFEYDKNMLIYLLKTSKTDKYNTGVKVYVCCSTRSICAYCYMKSYLRY
jgi:hypothetical protein